MKNICSLFSFGLLILIPLTSVFSQGGTWTWMSGTKQAGSGGAFGTQGVPSVNNHPPGFYEPCEWKDKQGNFWLFGGSIGYPDNYGDMWKYNPLTNEWTWVKGSGLPDDAPVYGTKGISNPSNTPGNRTFGAPTWVDTSGALWLWGGFANYFGSFVPFNDLWKYDTGTNEWTWEGGSTSPNASGVHGTQGIPSPSNTPGAKGESSSAWTDSLNNLWLFGGMGYDDNGIYGALNDLCMYSISSGEWTWMKGSAFINGTGSYGTKGVSTASNVPGARLTFTKWKDAQGYFWIMGGALASTNCYNDVWKYDPTNNEWTWMSGTSLNNNLGQYKANCVFDNVNMPYSRYEQRSAVMDNCGRFWLFGGVNEDGAIDSAFNDLWVFDPQQLKWDWLSGTNVANQAGNYGTKGIASPSNVPPSRCGAVAWWGNDNEFYLFGGSGFCDLWVFNPDTNCIPICNAVAVLPPVADFQSSSTTICANDCINYTDLSTNATSWQWSFAGAGDSTSSVQNPQDVCYFSSGVYNVTLIASNSNGSDTVTFSNYIRVNPAPKTPVIVQHGDMLICTTDPSYTSYQWYDSTVLIPGATDTLVLVNHSGDFNVRVTNVYNCKIAVGINIILGLQNYGSDNVISLSPNPATDELLVSGNWKSEPGKKILTIYNMLGEQIYTEGISPRSNMYLISCKSFPSGIYFVQLTTEKDRWIGRFVKQ